jgi:low affinity Fe/Cu permease
MNHFQNSDAFQKLVRFGVQATGRVATIGLAVFLILAWALTGPLFGLGGWIAQREKLKNEKGES